MTTHKQRVAEYVEYLDGIVREHMERARRAKREGKWGEMIANVRAAEFFHAKRMGWTA